MDVVFVLNCGSSSIKFQLIEPESGAIHLKGIAENLNTSRALLKWLSTGCFLESEKQAKQNQIFLTDESHSQSALGEKEKKSDEAAAGCRFQKTSCTKLKWSKGMLELRQGNYEEALSEILKLLGDEKILAVGHRVVHGGEAFNASVKIDSSVLDQIKACNHLAPLHNPVNALGIEEMLKKFPHIPQVAVFDTAFHQTMPQTAYLYALPYEYYKKYQVRRYGFHGTSHRYVVQKGAEEMGKNLKDTSFISCHLGNGCSIAAVKGGQCLDTSMGLTPLEGLVMGQRSGDLDPSIVDFLAEKLQTDSHEVLAILNRKSGLLGISGISEDMRLLTESSEPRAQLAIDIFCYRLAKYIASYLVPLQSVDGVIFTGGIGENAEGIRNQVMQHLKPFNLKPLVIPTNEELMIARDAAQLTGISS
ncbi:MAG: acetate kinase [Chlamydiia bacterium]|nr:acetate kinase [Chlamydiia bacterium]